MWWFIVLIFTENFSMVNKFISSYIIMIWEFYVIKGNKNFSHYKFLKLAATIKSCLFFYINSTHLVFYIKCKIFIERYWNIIDSYISSFLVVMHWIYFWQIFASVNCTFFKTLSTDEIVIVNEKLVSIKDWFKCRIESRQSVPVDLNNIK